VDALDRSRRRKYRQKTRKQTVNHLLACFLRASKKLATSRGWGARMMSSHAEIMIALLCESNGAMKFSRDPKRSSLKRMRLPSSIIRSSAWCVIENYRSVFKHDKHSGIKRANKTRRVHFARNPLVNRKIVKTRRIWKMIVEVHFTAIERRTSDIEQKSFRAKESAGRRSLLKSKHARAQIPSHRNGNSGKARFSSPSPALT